MLNMNFYELLCMGNEAFKTNRITELSYMDNGITLDWIVAIFTMHKHIMTIFYSFILCSARKTQVCCLLCLFVENVAIEDSSDFYKEEEGDVFDNDGR